NDLTLLVKGLNEAGVKVGMYTNDAGVTGTPTALASSGNGDVYVVSIGHPNIKGEIGDLVTGFQKRFNEDYSYFSSYTGLRLLSQAMANAKSTNPVRVAAAMEGLSLKGYAGDVTMRKDDHQLQQTMFITKWAPVSAANPYNVENTGYTFAPVKQIDVAQASTPTSCQMKRP
ncbi:MAG: branched-chain amino acid ABC transporter substrate-binding protein, partial [Comamonadaceae bacterium]